MIPPMKTRTMQKLRRSFATHVLPAVSLISAVTLADAGTGTTTASTTALAQDVDAQLDRVNRELRETEAHIEALRNQHDIVHNRLVARGRTYYRMRHAGLLPLGSGFDNLLDHTAKIERIRRSIQRDAQEANALGKEHASLVAHRTTLLDRQQPLEVKQRAMADANQALLESADRRQAFERAFGSVQQEAGDYTAVYGAPAAPSLGSSDVLLGGNRGFHALEGRLPFPLAGRTEVRVVRRRGAGGPGIEMVAPAGTSVLAVYAGRVAFADEYNPFGNVVILDHGDQYYSVSGDLGSIDVRVGEEVSAGTRVGTVGRSKPPGLLYFEIRHGADTLNPEPWFGL